MNVKTRKFYVPPTIEVAYLVTEGAITGSNQCSVELTDWVKDDNREEFDGDIWIKF
jgi:hypothetical protein